MALIALRRHWRWLMGLAIIALLAGGLLWWQKSDEITAVFITQADINLDDPASSIDGRLEIWSRAIYGLQDFPFTGMGMNNFRKVVHILYPLFLISPDNDIAHAHNQWLQAGLDLGLPGLIAYLAIWFGAAAMLFGTWRASRDFWQRASTIGFAGAMVASFVYGMTDAIALGAKPSFLWWMMLGLITGTFLHTKTISRPASADRAGNDSANGRLPSSPIPTDAHPPSPASTPPPSHLVTDSPSNTTQSLDHQPHN
jgi:putative inorganic carbon (HCO3(-)) transporter